MADSDPLDPIKPTPFDAVPTAPAHAPAHDSPPRRPGIPWVLPALGGLVLLALVVIFWLPAWVGDGTAPDRGPAAAPETATAAAKPGPATAPPGAATPDATPWSDAQAARLRKEAQDVLGELVDLQFTLEEHGAPRWAAEPFAAATASAAAGDELYKSRQYEQAKARYQEALTSLQGLQDAMPGELATRLEAARQAIEAGTPEPAVEALEIAELIEPGNAQAAALRERLEALPRVNELLAEAKTAEADGSLKGAEQALEQAVALDPGHQRVRAELARVSAALLELQFNAAMTGGYSALDGGRFEEARKAFRAAAKLRPDAGEVADALREVDAAATAHRLGSLQTTGLRDEEHEQWAAAVEQYQQALKLDPNVLFAREGLARAEPRAHLNGQLRKVIDEPGRLSDTAVAADAALLLAQAEAVDPRGPELAGQIDALRNLLRQASIPVEVVLHSDSETEVVVYKVARLGRFAERELSLRPGTYTAVGSRNGYRDVRRSFTVDPNDPPGPISIICTDPI